MRVLSQSIKLRSFRLNNAKSKLNTKAIGNKASVFDNINKVVSNAEVDLGNYKGNQMSILSKATKSYSIKKVFVSDEAYLKLRKDSKFQKKVMEGLRNFEKVSKGDEKNTVSAYAVIEPDGKVAYSIDKSPQKLSKKEKNFSNRFSRSRTSDFVQAQLRGKSNYKARLENNTKINESKNTKLLQAKISNYFKLNV